MVEATRGPPSSRPSTTTFHLDIEDPISYDPDKANQLLDEAGYTKGSDGIRTMPDGSDPLVYQLYSRSNRKTSQTTMELLQGWLKAIGIDSNSRRCRRDALRHRR